MGIDIEDDGSVRAVIASFAPRFGWEKSDTPEQDALDIADAILDGMAANGWVVGRVLKSGYVDLLPARHPLSEGGA